MIADLMRHFVELVKSIALQSLMTFCGFMLYTGWFCGTVVERWSLTSDG